MAGFLMKQIIGDKISNVKGGLDKLTGDKEGEGGDKAAAEEDPEVVQARIEAEERRKEKHRRLEAEREKTRQCIRDKYGIKKPEEKQKLEDELCAGRIGAVRRKTPEELAKEGEEDDSLMGQMNSLVSKAKTGTTGMFDSFKGMLGGK